MDTIRLRGPADVLAALPYQLGYHPQDAVVVIALRDRAIALVQRLDLPSPQEAGQAVAALLPPLVREDPDAVLVAGYESAAGAAMPVLDALADACAFLGIRLLDRLLVRDGRWFAPDCDGGCCPAEGMALPDPSQTPAVADFVAMEVAPVRDRASLGDRLATDEGLSRRVARAQRGTALAGAADPAQLGRWLSLWSQVCDVSASRPPLETVPPRDLAALLTSLRDVGLRDGVIGWLCPGVLPLDCLADDLREQLHGCLPERPWAQVPATAASVTAGHRLLDRLAFLCRAAPSTEAAPVLSLFANLAWWQGHGALARVALGRALDCEPSYRLALLLDRMLDLAIRPRQSA